VGLIATASIAFLWAFTPWKSDDGMTGASEAEVVGLVGGTIQTCGGQHFGDDHGEGSVCLFPFTYRGKTYTKCTTAGRFYERSPWCATSYRSTTRRRKRARSWGNCECKASFQTPSTLMSCGGERKPGIQKTQKMTVADYDAVAGGIVGEMNKLSNKCNSDRCPRADFAGCLLRVTGHDFMDFKDGKGGSDGCTDMTDPDNAGLAECLSTGEKHGPESVALNNVYNRFCEKISLADFLVVAAEAIMSELRPAGGRGDLDFKSRFRYGRKTETENCKFEFEHLILPNPEKSCEDVDRVFIKNMGLTKGEATALSGVHTLGRARLENSGYEGFWSDPHNSRIFNNNYFVSLVAKGWGPKKAVGGNPNKNMWIRSDVNASKNTFEMMLDSDMCLAYFENNEGVSARKHNCCAWFNPQFTKDGKPVGLAPEITNGKLCDAPLVAPGGPSREVCCETFGANKGKSEIDCGSPVSPNGLGGEDVFLFAKDEQAWLKVFIKAWKKATELGHTGLATLTH
jgi:hypothetical protein